MDGGRVATNLGGVDVVPLLGAIVAAGRDGQIWGSGAIAAIVVCCGWGGRKTTNFGGVVPLLGAIAAEGKGG